MPLTLRPARSPRPRHGRRGHPTAISRAASRIRRKARRRVPRDLSAHLMRDIGLEPRPERPIVLSPRW
ncbi:hypothetical protein STA1M1_23070 [Sinisalibacter aestuarii]|uniref:DUF1127 domain-containing protein n=1 Tax=Sinisalibacter aestuarii TaxID=2949426 RepID=A0ABQ5LUJ8_9RHOB|nr:hypothetical protein STA1M1_23070 [Sinisalibacter aestuarii]